MKIILTSDLHFAHTAGYTKKIIKLFVDNLKECDALVIAGDMISHCQSEWIGILKILRDRYPTTPIITVLGNHDYWDVVKKKIDENRIRSIYESSVGMRYRYEPTKKSYEHIANYHKKIFDRFNITHLQGNCIDIHGTKFWGLDDWYSKIPMSNDGCNISFTDQYSDGFGSRGLHNHMHKIAIDQLNNILDNVDENDKNILVTHFNPIGQYRDTSMQMEGNLMLPDLVEGKFDAVLFGHTHRSFDSIIKGVHYYNCGSEYDDPKMMIIEE